MQKVASFLIKKHGLYDSFYIANLNTLRSKIQEWKTHLPDIHPFYAMKCNPDKKMLKLMIANGLGFDCASKRELKTALSLGASPQNIIFAHPVKKIPDLSFAVSQGIRYTTFDSVSELQKLKAHAPHLQCIIRLRVDNPSARVQLGLKYGADKHEYKHLIDAAKQANLNITGCSFHVGSASKDPHIFRTAIEYSKEVFDYARSQGFTDMHLLDVGGGFTKETFKDAAQVLSTSINDCFKTEQQSQPNFRIIAEPGRYFAEEIFTFFTPVIGQKEKNSMMEYWLSDGLYGSFNCVVYDQQSPSYQVLRNPLMQPQTTTSEIDINMRDSILWGCSCDTYDKVTETPVQLPLLRNGDYLQLNNFGAYTISAAKDFNGIKMAKPRIFYVAENQGCKA